MTGQRLMVVRGTSVEQLDSGWLGHHAYRLTAEGWEAAIMRAMCCARDGRPALALLDVEGSVADPELPNPHKVIYATAVLVRVLYLTRPEVFVRGTLAEAYG